MARSSCAGTPPQQIRSAAATSWRNQFEIRELTNLNVPGSGPAFFKFNAIQCASCGIVVGTHEGAHIGTALLAIADKLGIPPA